MTLTGAGSNTLFADLDLLDKKLEALGITEVDGVMTYSSVEESENV